MRTGERVIRRCRMCLCFLLLMVAGGTEAFAAVTEGTPGNTYSGEYAVIVNTSITDSASTGTLVFDSDVSSETSRMQAFAADGGTDSLPDTEKASVQTVFSSSSAYTVGQEKYIDRGAGHWNGKTYVCIGIGQHCYIWMEKGLKEQYDASGKTETIAEDMAGTYDGRPYEVLNEMCGGRIPYLDNSGKLSVLLETLDGASGMYAGDNGITALHINVPAAASYIPGDMNSRNGLLVHEGQHALLNILTGAETDAAKEYRWINEGVSVAAMDYLWGGTDSSGWLDYIAGNTEIRNGSSLIYQTYRNSAAQDYSMTCLFVRYLINRKTGGYDPMSFFPLLYESGSAANIHSTAYVEKVMGGNTSFADLLTDFYTAIIALEPNGRYGFAGDALVAEKVKDYPFYLGESGKAHMLERTGAIVLRLDNGTFTVPTDGDSSVRYRIVGSRTSVVPSKGDGTAQNPYEIASPRDLSLLASNKGAHYKLTADITMGSVPYVTCTQFYGVLDGNNHTIRGLLRPLIGYNGGTIKDLTIEAAINGEFVDSQGVFVQVNSGKISGCRVSGTAKVKLLAGKLSYPAFGGIVGRNELSGIISGCGSSLEMTVICPMQEAWVGGIVGLNMYSTEQCCHRGKITVSRLSDSYAVNVGGIAGEIRKYGGMGGFVKNCVNYGTIQASGEKLSAGQICGLANTNVVNSSYGVQGHITSCYGKNGGYALLGSPSEAQIAGSSLLTEEQLKDSSNYQGWSFGGDWKMGEEGPDLTGPEDITSLSASGSSAVCFVGEKPYNWGTLLVNNTVSIPIEESMVSGFDSSTPGQKTVKVTYRGHTTTFARQVTKPTEIVITGMSGKPKASYVEGERFDPSGASLLATLDGYGNRVVGSGFDYDKKEPLTRQDTFVTFSYFGKTYKFPITVSARTTASFTLNSKMTKTLYQEGDKLDISGVKVQITYSNGTKSALIGPEEFEKYGICLAKMGDGGTAAAISAGSILTAADNGKGIYIYGTDVLPGLYGSVSKYIGTVTVQEKMRMEDAELHVTAGRKIHLPSHAVTGGSESYTTTVIKENLPAGLSRSYMPGEYQTVFEYEGTVTAPVGRYESLYRITDNKTGNSILVTVTIHVHSSNEASMLRFDLQKEFNGEYITEDVKGVIGENTIILRLPEGTDVTSLQPSVEYGSDMGVELPNTFWNGSRHDFTHPVKYVLTAPDKVTKKVYTVSVEFYEKGSEPACRHTKTEWIVWRKPTCTAQGLQIRRCSVCKTTLETRKISAGGHKAGAWKTTKPATGKSTGLREKKCTVCGKILEKQTIARITATLNAGWLPLQVGKSTKVLKIVKKGTADSVLSWNTSNKKIATVDKNGKIKAKKAGKATITVTMRSGATASCVIKVQKQKVKTTKLSLPKASVTLKVKQKYQIKPMRTPLTATDKISYKSSNKKIVTVTSGGKVTAKKKGTAKITVRAASGKKVVLKITVK